jgi:hypothetical protein
VAIKAERDQHGTHWLIPADPIAKTPGGRTLGGYSGLAVWWDRDPRNKADETLIIRQDNGEGHADLILTTLGQAYDLIAALNQAVENA